MGVHGLWVPTWVWVCVFLCFFTHRHENVDIQKMLIPFPVAFYGVYCVCLFVCVCKHLTTVGKSIKVPAAQRAILGAVGSTYIASASFAKSLYDCVAAVGGGGVATAENLFRKTLNDVYLAPIPAAHLIEADPLMFVPPSPLTFHV